MDRILAIIKKVIPQRLFRSLQPAYHFAMNACAALVYGFPSRHMIVVGITGTTGKTTTTFLLAHLLRSAGMRVGYTSTALLSDGEADWINDKKMTMLGRFFTQRILAQMRRNRCDVAIVETTSEGIVQYRHRFINYDVLLFTGIYPEHIESHGGFEAYKQAKLRLFTHLSRCTRKRGITVPKTIVVNGDDNHACDFLAPWAQQKVVFAQGKGYSDCYSNVSECMRFVYRCDDVCVDGVRFTFDGMQMQAPLLGAFSVINSVAAASVARVLGMDNKVIAVGMHNLPNVPGRMERIEVPAGFTVIVDYAFEPVAMINLYDVVKQLASQRIIHVLGGTGGGRDRARRPKIGAIAGECADYVIVTNEDPYDEDPRGIMDDVARGVECVGKVRGETYEIIENRAEAIRRALQMARKGDIVLITGKGCEQAICVADGVKVPHDDRAVVRAFLESEV